MNLLLKYFCYSRSEEHKWLIFFNFNNIRDCTNSQSVCVVILHFCSNETHQCQLFVYVVVFSDPYTSEPISAHNSFQLTRFILVSFLAWQSIHERKPRCIPPHKRVRSLLILTKRECYPPQVPAQTRGSHCWLLLSHFRVEWRWVDYQFIVWSLE